MKRKEQHRAKLLDYWGNTENEFLNRHQAALTVLNYSDSSSLYRIFSPEDLDEIEAEAMAMRMKQTARQRVNVYEALYREAIKGNVSAAKEWLDRVEGKVTEKVDIQAAAKQQDMVIRVYGISADGGPPEEQRKRLEEEGKYVEIGKQKLLENK